MDRAARVQLQSPSSPAAITRNSDVTLRCRADGAGDVTYQWFRNGQRLKRAPGRALRNKRLVLSGVQSGDNGVYSCRANNAAGSAHSDVTFPLIVPGKYDVISSWADLEQDRLPCKESILTRAAEPESKPEQ